MALTRGGLAAQAAAELRDSQYVNIGIGLPTLVPRTCCRASSVWVEQILGDPYKGDADLVNAAGPSPSLPARRRRPRLRRGPRSHVERVDVLAGRAGRAPQRPGQLSGAGKMVKGVGDRPGARAPPRRRVLMKHVADGSPSCSRVRSAPRARRRRPGPCRRPGQS